VARALTLQRRIIVFGSSSLLASFRELGEPGNLLETTFDADFLVDDIDDQLAAVLNEAIGEDSLFQSREGYYIDVPRPAITELLPQAWEQRLIALRECENVFCLEPHDLAVAKLRAGRPKDIVLLRDLLCAGRLKAEIVRERLALTRMSEAAIAAAHQTLCAAEQA